MLDDNGTAVNQIGSSLTLPDVNRNGNLQLTQFYYGAAQPSYAAAASVDALFYGAAADNGGPFSAGNIITTGNLTWNVPNSTLGNVSWDTNDRGVSVDQQGLGTVDQYWFPGAPPYGTTYTDFFQVNSTGQTYGLLQAAGNWPTPDPQWPTGGPGVPTGGQNMAVNPIDGQEMVVSSDTGNIFSTSNGGQTWFDIGAPAVFGSPGNFSVALAYGAPDPGAPSGVGNLGNFIYVGTSTGQIYATQVGGGSGSTNNWILVGSTANGLDGSQIEAIVTNPTRGSHQAYAVTQDGVYVIGNSIPSSTIRPRPGPTSPATSSSCLIPSTVRAMIRPQTRAGSHMTWRRR